MPKNPFILLIALLVIAPVLAAADDQQAQSAETRMRQMLRDTIGQLRDAQNQVVTLQALRLKATRTRPICRQRSDSLTTQLKSVTDQAASDKSDSDKAIADLRHGSTMRPVKLAG